MKLSDLSIRRPVLASMVSLALVLFGAIGYTRLAVREFPDVDPPIVSVSTELPGANPQVVESAVTDILEEELSTVEGLRTLTSSSAEGFSNITLEFNLERPVEAAAQDVRDKVARIRGRLPEDVREPVVAKQEADAQPFMTHFTKHVIDGEPQAGTRCSGHLEYWDSKGGPLCRVSLAGVDVASVTPERSDVKSKDVKLVKVDLSVESMKFEWLGGGAGSPGVVRV